MALPASFLTPDRNPYIGCYTLRQRQGLLSYIKVPVAATLANGMRY